MTKIVLKKHKISDHEGENGSFYTKKELDLNKLENHHLFYDDKVNCEASAPLTQARVFCSKCDRKFIDSSSLQRHVAFRHFPKKTARHMNLTPIPSNLNLSDLNENSIPTVHEEKKSQSKRHAIIYAGEKNFGCKNCEKRFIKPNSAKYHELKSHFLERRRERANLEKHWPACKSCDVRFSTQQGLKSHEKSKTHNFMVRKSLNE